MVDLRGRLDDLLWREDADPSRSPARLGLKALRVAYGVLRELSEGQITLRAMSLVYASLLSLVPLLAVSFAMLKAFGAHNQIEPLLRRLLLPLGDQGAQINDRIIGFVDNVNAGALGGVGLAVLVYTAVSLVQKLENAFNDVWRVRESRRLARRFSDYLSVVTIGPLLVFAALGSTASALNNGFVRRVMAIEPFGTLIVEATRYLPYLLIIGAFTFFYIFITNTRVKPVPALIGAAVAGVLWQTLGYGFGVFVKLSGNTQVIYSSFAILILFLVWLYLSWLSLLLGSQVAYFVQNPRASRHGAHPPRLGNREHERASLELLCEAALRHHRGQKPATAAELAAQAGIAEESADRLAEQLSALGYLERVAHRASASWVIGRDPSQIPLGQVLQQIRTGERPRQVPAGNPAILDLLDTLDTATRAALVELSLRDLAMRAANRAEEKPAPAMTPAREVTPDHNH